MRNSAARASSLPSSRMERLLYNRLLVRVLSFMNVAVRLTHLAQATGSCVLGADDDLVNANVAPVTEPDGEVGVFGVVVELGDTHDGWRNVVCLAAQNCLRCKAVCGWES